jgi:TonB family protein
MHSRIHAVFTDDYLADLETRHPDPSLDQPTLRSAVEIVLDPTDGRVERLGIVSSSGSPEFDVGVLDSVERASPFGPASAEIVSSDGYVYLQWSFSRDLLRGCMPVGPLPLFRKMP